MRPPNKGGRPRKPATQKLPKGVRCVEGKLYWRGTDAETRAIEQQLREEGISRRCGGARSTLAEVKQWIRENVEPRMKGEAA